MELVLFRTPTEWVALALLFIAGWAWGFASAPGSRKWRLRLAEAEEEYASFREAAEAELRETKQRLAAAQPAPPAPVIQMASSPPDLEARLGVLEAENARLVRYLRAPRPDPEPVSPAPPSEPAAPPVAALQAAPPEPMAAPLPVAQTAPPSVPPPAPSHTSGWLHAMEAGVAGAVVGAVADRLVDRADGTQDHGVLHNIGAAAAGAAVGVLTEKLAERHAAREAERKAKEDSHAS